MERRRYDLGLSDLDFWDCTFEEFSALLRRHHLKNASYYSFQANLHRDPKLKAEPFTPEDFMPKTEEMPATEEQMLSFVCMMNAMLGGEDGRGNV